MDLIKEKEKVRPVSLVTLGNPYLKKETFVNCQAGFYC